MPASVDPAYVELVAGLDALSEGIVLAGADGTIRLINDAGTRLTSPAAAGTRLETWFASVGFLAPDQTTPADVSKFALLRALEGEQPPPSALVVRGEHAGRGKQPPHHLLISARPVRGRSDGAVRGAIAVMKDVTADRLATAERDRLLARLGASNDELRELAMVASHDLRAPMRKIRMFTDRLLRERASALDETAMGYVHRIKAIAERGNRLVEALLHCTSISSGGLRLSTVDLGKLVRESVAELDSELTAIGAEVRVAPLPTVEADEDQMRQLFQNLLANAVKYRSASTPLSIGVEGMLLRSADGEEWLVVTVADNGRGFSAEEAKRLFGLFTRLHAGENDEGLGIGLALCRRIAVRHGGSIGASGVPGQGARFEIRLPVTQQSRGRA